MRLYCRKCVHAVHPAHVHSRHCHNGTWRHLNGKCVPMIPDRPNFLADAEPVGIICLSAGRSLGDNTGKYGRLKRHCVNANVLAFVGEEHGHFAAVRCRQCHEIVSGVGNGVIFLAVPVAGTVDIHPALSGKATEMHCQPETNIQNKVSGPRLPGISCFGA